MHRFCKECIEKALRLGKKECPTCRKLIVSHRSLREDENFDKLIRIFYPTVELFEEKQQIVMQKVFTHSNFKAFVESVEDGMKVNFFFSSARWVLISIIWLLVLFISN